MKSLILVILFLALLFLGCTYQESAAFDDTPNRSIQVPPPTQQIQSELDQTIDQTIEDKTKKASLPESEIAKAEVGLGDLCSGEEECKGFYLNNRGKCEKYCKGNYENKLCPVIFPREPEGQSQQQFGKECTGNGSATFISPPMRIEDIEMITPLGQMNGGHVTPTDHGYYTAKGWKPQEGREDQSKFRDVLAPADGIISGMGSMPKEFSSSSLGDYRFYIYHTCTFYTIYIHVNQLSPKLQALADGRSSGIVEVKAGEVIGRAPAFDFSVHDEQVELKGFIIPEHYEGESWKIHTADMFAYFAEPVKSQLLAKNVRQKEPRSGKIDYDVDGKLIGNWFLEGTQDYSGRGLKEKGLTYWYGHLSFVYDAFDPSLIIVSIGNFNNEPRQFAVKGNSPDPARVNENSGIVKYELVEMGYRTEEGRIWDRMSFAKVAEGFGYEYVQGVVLVQMIDDRKIRFEVFPGKTVFEVNGFTENAKIYER